MIKATNTQTAKKSVGIETAVSLQSAQPNIVFDQGIFRLACLAFVTIGLTPHPITPILKGGFPQNTFRGQVCLLQENLPEEENFTKGFIVRVMLVVQMIYTVRFVRQANRFVAGQCPAGKMCSIGKYRRNIFGMESTFRAALCGSAFPLLDYCVRFLSRTLNKWQAFYINFIILDSIVYIAFVSILVVAHLQSIPCIIETPRRTMFYVTKPQKLEPRRRYDASNPITDQINRVETICCSSSPSYQPDQTIHVPVPKITKVKERDQNSQSKENTDEIVLISSVIVKADTEQILESVEMAVSGTEQKVPASFVYLSKKLFRH